MQRQSGTVKYRLSGLAVPIPSFWHLPVAEEGRRMKSVARTRDPFLPLPPPAERGGPGPGEPTSRPRPRWGRPTVAGLTVGSSREGRRR